MAEENDQSGLLESSQPEPTVCDIDLDDDGFDEIALDATPALGVLNFHGSKPVSRRPRRRRFEKKVCSCASGTFRMYAEENIPAKVAAASLE